MKNTSKSRPSIKRSLANINIKGVPHTTITLKPKVANTKDSLSNVSFNSTNSRANSFTCSENQFKVVSMGSLCHRKQNKSIKKYLFRKGNRSFFGQHLEVPKIYALISFFNLPVVILLQVQIAIIILNKNYQK